VDLTYVHAQGVRGSTRRVVRVYVRGGFERGLSLNPLFTERLVSGQLPDAGRVPALYAYLVNDVRTVRTSVAWDAVGHAQRHPGSLQEPGGPVGHAWRAARAHDTLRLDLGGRSISVPWEAVWRELAEAQRAIRAGDGGFPLPDRLPGETVVLCRLAQDEGDAAVPLTSAGQVAARLRAPLVISIAGGTASDWTNSLLIARVLPDVYVIPDSPSVVDDISRRSPDDTILLVRGPHSEISPDDLIALAEAAAFGPIAPLWLGFDGTVASAGILAHSARAFHLLADHPAEDARRLGEFLPVDAITDVTFARRAGDAMAPGRTALQLTSRAPAPAESPTALSEDSAAILDDVLEPIGMQVARWTQGGPHLVRAASVTVLPDGRSVPRLRWAIKIVAPPGPPGEAWGDTHFARGLADSLRRLGQDVVIDAYDARHRRTGHLDDVVLALRGPEPFRAQPGARSLMWIISHPDQITADEVGGFDLVFAASHKWASTADSRLGRPVRTLLQCTDSHRFRPTGARRTDRILFVGTARGIPRPSVIEPINAGIPVSVYGPDWRGWIPADSISGTGLPNAELPLMYESSALVLNDHWPAMQESGFVSNRLFDVVAAGGRAISDEVDGIDEIFAGAVRTYETVDELITMLRSDPNELFPEDARLAEISMRIRAEHSFDARALTLLEAALAL